MRIETGCLDKLIFQTNLSVANYCKIYGDCKIEMLVGIF